MSFDDDTANPWSDDPAQAAPAKTAPSFALGPHQGALVDPHLLDLESELDGPPPARPMDIPREMREPPLPQSLKQSKYDTRAYEPRRSHSPRPVAIGDVLASRDPEQLDPFESYVTSIDSTHTAQRRRPEGAVLMQLHANLDALARTADHHSTTPELFESDVRAILQHALDMLPEHETPPATRGASVRPAIRAALDRSLSTPASMSSVQQAVLARLQQLWDAYTAHTAPRRLAYEPRRPPSRTSSTGVARVRSPELQRNVASTEGITTISVVDVSANAERAGPVDVRTLQVLISIEDVASNTGGYVLLRSWAQFEALHAELERMYAQRPADTVLSAPPPPLPNVRKTPLDQHVLDPDEPASARQFRVPVLEDRLFDVDLERMIVYPALWPGFDQGVIRATWFYVSPDGSCSPIAWGSAVSDDLERAFDEARPWDLAPRLRATLQSTTKAKADAEPPPLYDLPSVVGGAKVMFDSAVSARVYTYVAAR